MYKWVIFYVWKVLKTIYFLKGYNAFNSNVILLGQEKPMGITLEAWILHFSGKQKKGYKVICLLFDKTEWHMLFAYCKHNVCCFRVDLPNSNQVQWSETSVRQFEWFCTTCTILSAFGYYGSQIDVVVETECSKPAENHQTLITTHLQETLVLAQNTQNNEKIKIFWKAYLLTLKMTFLLFNVFLASFCIFVQRRKYLRGRDFKIFL